MEIRPLDWVQPAFAKDLPYWQAVTRDRTIVGTVDFRDGQLYHHFATFVPSFQKLVTPTGNHDNLKVNIATIEDAMKWVKHKWQALLNPWLE